MQVSMEFKQDLKKLFDTLTNIETRVDLAEKGVDVGEMAALEFADAFLGSIRDAMVKNMSSKLTNALMGELVPKTNPQELASKAGAVSQAAVESGAEAVNRFTGAVDLAANALGAIQPPVPTPAAPAISTVGIANGGTVGFSSFANGGRMSGAQK